MTPQELSGHGRRFGSSVDERGVPTFLFNSRTCVASPCISAVLLLMVIALPGGCGEHLLRQDGALRNAIKQGRIKGVTPRDIPWERVVETDKAGAGEFSKLDILNISVSMPDYTTQWWSVVLGISRADGNWKIIRVAQYDGPKRWVSIPVLPGKDVPSSAGSSGWGSVDKQGKTLKCAIREGRIAGVRKEDREKINFVWAYPGFHKGEFSRVDIRNLDVHKSDGAMEHWAVVFGQPLGKDWWEVIRVARQTSDGEGENLLLSERTQSPDSSADNSGDTKPNKQKR